MRPDSVPRTIVATGFSDQPAISAEPLELEFRYRDSTRTISVSRILGPKNFHIILSNVDPSSCQTTGPAFQLADLRPAEWVRKNVPAFGSDGYPSKLLEISAQQVDPEPITCNLQIRARTIDPDMREMAFLHVLDRSDDFCQAVTPFGSVDRFVLDEDEAQNVRADDDSRFYLDKKYNRANVAALISQAPTNAYAEFSLPLDAIRGVSGKSLSGPMGNALRAKELLFFLAGLFSAVGVSCILEQFRDILSGSNGTLSPSKSE